MLATKILCVFLGITFGFAASAGLFALITSITVVPRLADKTHTKSHIKTYESAIITGGTLWNLFFIFKISLNNILNTYMGNAVIGLFGLFSGIYVGCLAMALAERLSVTAILKRRIRLHVGMSYVILIMALGKLVGGLIYFKFGWPKI